MFTHQHSISMSPIRLDPESANPEPQRHQEALATVTKSRLGLTKNRIYLHVHSPTLISMSPIRLDPESANPEPQRHQEALATAKFNLHATHPSRSRERKPGGTKASGHRATVMRSGIYRLACALTYIQSPCHPSVPVQRAQTWKHRGIRTSGGTSYRNEEENIFACALTNIQSPCHPSVSIQRV